MTLTQFKIHFINALKFVLIFVFIAEFSACTKKRDESFVQGQGRDMLLISDYDGKEFPVETLGKIADYKENPAISKSEVVTKSKDHEKTGKVAEKANGKMTVSANDQSLVSEMGAVKVKTDADLLGDVPFIALPNRSSGYKIKYSITKDFLVVLKVANKKLIHPKELPGAIDQGNDEVGVPLVGYAIKGFINTENVEQNGAKSNKVIEMSVNDKTGARFFKIDKNNRTIYKLQDKMDLFTKEYFEGSDGKSEWFFGQTIIAAGAANADYTGWVMAQQDNDLNAMSKVKFMFNRTEMRAVSVNIDSRINNKDELNQMVLVQFPIDWKEYRPTQSGNSSYTMSEEETESVAWDKRRYVKINFAGVSTITISNPNFRFVDLEVDTDYFSFTILDPSNNIRIKHSFLRDVGRKAYTPKRMFKEDFEKYGFFSTQKHEVNNYEKYRQEDFGKNIFINRYNIANGEVKFYFTEGSDENLIPAAAKAADEWSEAFAKAGVPLKITAVTDKDKRVRLGDLRYNQINLIRSTTESGLFGYGPSITDPRTGEIIAATTNMHLTSIVSYLSQHIRDYLLFKSGVSKKLSLYVLPPIVPTNMVIKGDKAVFEEGSSEDYAVSKLLKKMPVIGLNGQLQYKNIEVKEPTQSAASRIKLQKNWGREFDIGVTGKNLNLEIEKMCPELEKASAALSSETHLDDENKLVIACAEKLLPHKMFGTLLHEMGHNFGLRHNFYGSVDALNFLNKEDTKTDEQVQSSSVMEYSSFGEDRLTKVGKYDVAAIRYGYADAVELNDGTIAKLDVKRPIVQNFENKTELLKHFMFCTDEDVEIGTDPMCARHDAGTNPDEVAYNLINEYNASIAEYNYRLSRQRTVDPMRLTNYRVRRYWVPLKRFYDEWRFKLNDQLGTGNEYLESFDKKQLEKDITEKTATCSVTQNPTDAQKQIYSDPSSSSCQLLAYKNASERIYKFAKQMATLPPKYCIGSRNGKIASVEFADVRRIITATHKFVPKDCKDKDVAKYIQDKFAFTPQMESGYELEDVRLDMKIKMTNKTDWWGNPIPEPPDIIGLMPEKAIAVEVLAVRAPLTMASQEKSFTPNFLDEPKHREDFLAYIADRISRGFNANLIMTGDKALGLDTKFIEKFVYEKRYIDSLVYSVFNGLDVPEKTYATKERKKRYSVRYTSQKDILDKAKYKVPGLDGTTYYAIMSDDATEAKKLLQVLESLPKRLEAASPLNGETFLKLNELAVKTLGESDTTISAEQFLTFIYLVIEDEFPPASQSGRSQDSKNMDKYRPHWKKVLQKETSLVRDLMSTLTNDNNEGSYLVGLGYMAKDLENYFNPKSPQKLKPADAEKMAVKSIGALLYSDGYTLNQKKLAERIEKYMEIAQKERKDKKEEQNDDIYNYEELTTQMDLIMKLLRQNTEYVF